MNKFALLLMLCCGLSACTPRGTTQTSPPSSTPTPEATPWVNDARWIEKPWATTGKQWYLICNQSGKIIANIAPDGGSSGNWICYGGDGNSYGTFATKDDAMKHLDAITSDPEMAGRGSKLLHCP